MESVVVIRFEQQRKAYQALGALMQCDTDRRIELEAVAIVERTTDGKLLVLESADYDPLVRTASGSLIGMLIGALGGPVGLLLGWGTGAAAGAAFDTERALTSQEALSMLGGAIPPRSTAVVVSVTEPVVNVVDDEMSKLGGEVTRRSRDEVIDELQVVQEEAGRAAREARRLARENRRAKRAAAFEKRTAGLKEKLHVS